VSSEPLREVDEWLSRFRRFWIPHLDALTTVERIARWFLPVSGDLRLGGRVMGPTPPGTDVMWLARGGLDQLRRHGRGRQRTCRERIPAFGRRRVGVRRLDG
jgi:hypothetical protein